VEGLVAYLNINGARRLTRTRLVKGLWAGVDERATFNLFSTMYLTEFGGHTTKKNAGRVCLCIHDFSGVSVALCIHDFSGVSVAGKMLMLTYCSTRNYLCLQSSVQFARTLSMSKIHQNSLLSGASKRVPHSLPMGQP
jgi:hypothetical protein